MGYPLFNPVFTGKIKKKDKRFITEWNIVNTSFTIYSTQDVLYRNDHDYYVDFGDGTPEVHVTTSARPTHTYASTGTYQIKIRGSFPGFNHLGTNIDDQLTKVLNWGNVGFKTFAYAFYYDQNLIELPEGPITGCEDTVSFYTCFTGCTGLTSIPVGFFDNCINVTTFQSCFSGCTLLTTIPVGLFDNCPDVTSFQNCFVNLNITEIPAGLFDNCSDVTTFNGCFSNTDITTIPTGLFDNCTEVTSFGFVFMNCSLLVSIPAGLFDNCTKVTSFGFVFMNCSLLTSIPVNLFRYNTLVTTFNSAFRFCLKLQLNSWIFYADGEQSTRFANVTISFETCFDRYMFTGIQGIAPDLWNCNFGGVIETDCFNGVGNSLTSLSNYASIPVAWK